MELGNIQHELVCPRDLSDLREAGSLLVCTNNHQYPVVDGVPVMLIEEVPPTHEAITESIEHAKHEAAWEYAQKLNRGDEVDEVAQALVAPTGGYLYRGLTGKLTRYPIPELRLPDGDGQKLLDIGCSWGRWTVAAARKGYYPVGIDPSLGPVLAARRICRQLKLNATFVVADARYLPFKSESFDVAFSYSVIQHFSKADARQAIKQIARVIKASGSALIQMPNAFGVRSLYHQLRRGFRRTRNFDVRYWTLPELRKTFSELIGPTEVSVDGFFGLGVQAADKDLLPPHLKMIVNASEGLRAIERKLPALSYIADSLYLQSRLLKANPTEHVVRTRGMTH